MPYRAQTVTLLCVDCVCYPLCMPYGTGSTLPTINPHNDGGVVTPRSTVFYDSTDGQRSDTFKPVPTSHGGIAAPGSHTISTTFVTAGSIGVAAVAPVVVRAPAGTDGEERRGPQVVDRRLQGEQCAPLHRGYYARVTSLANAA
jgi:hypothetical protein